MRYPWAVTLRAARAGHTPAASHNTHTPDLSHLPARREGYARLSAITPASLAVRLSSLAYLLVTLGRDAQGHSRLDVEQRWARANEGWPMLEGQVAYGRSSSSRGGKGVDAVTSEALGLEGAEQVGACGWGLTKERE